MRPSTALLRCAATSSRGQRATIAASAGLYMSWQACEALVPVAIGVIIDRAVERGSGTAILVSLGALAALFVALSLSFRFAFRLSTRAAQRSAHELRVAVADAVLDPRRPPTSGRHTGELLSIASSDADKIGRFTALLPRTCGAVVSVLVTAGALLRISLPLALLVLVCAPALLGAMQLLGAPLERRAAHEQAEAARAAGLATDFVAGLRVLKGIGAGPAAAARYRTASVGSLRATVRAAEAEAGYDAVTLLLTMAFLALVALAGGRLAAEGRISVGDLVAAVGLAQFLLGPLSQLASLGVAVARARASADRVAGVLGGASARTATAALPDGPGAVTVSDGALRLAVRPGELLGVAAGHADADRLVRLLADAAYDTDGDVRVDGVAVHAVDPAQAHMALLVAQHDARLFAGTVAENVRAGLPPDAVATAVNAAIVAADVDQVIATLPDGADTMLSERGRSLSGGQRQRVLLARALTARPRVLVLHDPTTAVDSATEARIATGLRAQRAGHTTVIIASSPALLAICDRVVLLRDGRVAAEGTHATLVADAAYRDLVLS
jgi:putative ABC transport system ATP-binding protein